MALMAIPKFERLFRAAAEIDVDKDDLKRYSDFVNNELYDLLLVGQAATRFNDRGMMELWDLPITKGFQERIHEFRKLDQDIELQPILDELAVRPQLDVLYSDDLLQRLPEIVGGISVALAHSFRIVDTGVKNPSSEHWERAFQLFNLLL
jgi:Domain of unknown function (DUF1931)